MTCTRLTERSCRALAHHNHQAEWMRRVQVAKGERSMALGKQIAYSAGNFGINLYSQAFATFGFFFYVDHLQASAELIGLGMGIQGVLNAILNPLVGHISDRTQTRFGRRVPYIMFGAIPLALAFIFIWTPFVHHTSTALFWYFLTSVFLYDVMFVLVVLNWTALFPEMYPTLRERAGVSAWRQGIGILGMILGVAFPPILYSAFGWTAMAVLFGAIGLVTMLISLYGIRERPNPQPQPHAERGVPILRALRLTFVNRSFVPYVIASFFIQFPFVLIPAVMPFFTKYALHATHDETTILLGTLFITALPFVYVWSAITRRTGARTAMMAAAAIFAVALIPFAFVRTFTAAWIAMAPLGAALAGMIILLDVLISDVIDEDEMRSGARREGMYYGVQGFIIRFGVTLQAIVMSQVFTRTGYVPDRIHQAPQALAGMHDMLSVVPLGSLIIALVALYLYPLHGRRLEGVVQFRAARDAELAADSPLAGQPLMGHPM
ncbi:MAG: MFS transporter [Bacilli bacterium]